jgi:hypothetical protein
MSTDFLVFLDIVASHAALIVVFVVAIDALSKGMNK